MALLLFFTDAILTPFFDVSESLVDAILRQVIHNEFKFSDVHLQDVLHLEEGPRLDFTVDGQTILRPDNDFDVDAFLNSLDNEFDFDVDANIQIMPSENFEADALLQETFTDDFDVDAILVNREVDEYDLDAVVVRRPLNEFLVDPITIGELDLDFTVNAHVAVVDIEHDFLVDGIPELVPRTRPIVDAYILDTFVDESLVDARLILRPNNDFSVDANLQKDGFLPFNVDAFLLDVFGLFTFVDAQLVLPTGDIDVCTVHFCTPEQPALFFTVDAIIVQPTPFEFSVDAHIEDIQGLNFQVDAFLAQRFVDEFTVDASIIKPSQFNACPSLIRESLNCISVIRRRGS